MQPNTWAMICHLSGLTGYLANGFGSIIAPLILWLIKKDEVPAVDQHGKEALNFNISIAIYLAVLSLVTIVTFGIGLLLTGPLMVGVAIFHFVCVVVAAIKANNGEFFRYPLCLRLVK